MNSQHPKQKQVECLAQLKKDIEDKKQNTKEYETRYLDFLRTQIREGPINDRTIRFSPQLMEVLKKQHAALKQTGNPVIDEKEEEEEEDEEDEEEEDDDEEEEDDDDDDEEDDDDDSSQASEDEDCSM